MILFSFVFSQGGGGGGACFLLLMCLFAACAFARASLEGIKKEGGHIFSIFSPTTHSHVCKRTFISKNLIPTWHKTSTNKIEHGGAILKTVETGNDCENCGNREPSLGLIVNLLLPQASNLWCVLFCLYSNNQIQYFT